jgi:hypothetical protein
MPAIRYICVSDLHLGAENSLLTQLGSAPGEVDTSRPSEVLVEFASCLRELVRHNESLVKPTLILNGDALELALAQDNVALMAFERFLELMFPINGEAWWRRKSSSTLVITITIFGRLHAKPSMSISSWASAAISLVQASLRRGTPQVCSTPTFWTHIC